MRRTDKSTQGKQGRYIRDFDRDPDPYLHERDEHPLKRIMDFEKRSDVWLLTFTDAHLARGVAEALRHAYQGEVDFHYTPDDVMLRATWTR